MWSWPFSRRPAPSRAEVESSCAFCGRSRADVRILVAGPKASICDACLEYAVAAADVPDYAARAQPFPVVAGSLREILKALPLDTPHAVSTPVLAAATALASTNAERESLSLEAFRLRNPPAALALLDVPGATTAMTLNAAPSWISAGRAKHALDRLRAIDPEPLGAQDRVQLALNQVAALLELRPVDEALVERMIADAKAGLAAAGDEPWALSWRVCVDNDHGDLALLRGDPAAAERCYRAALARGAEQDPFTWRRLGDALAGLGRAPEARAAWQAGLEQAHPDTPIAERLRERIASAG